jgi:hypothetical protein
MIRPDDLESDEGRGIWETLAASANGDVAALRLLLDRNPRLSRAQYWYLPAVHFAAREGHAEAVQLLLDVGADPEWNGLHDGSLIDMAGTEATGSCATSRGRSGPCPAESSRTRRSPHSHRLSTRRPETGSSAPRRGCEPGAPRRLRRRHAAPSRHSARRSRHGDAATRLWRRCARGSRLGTRPQRRILDRSSGDRPGQLGWSSARR